KGDQTPAGVTLVARTPGALPRGVTPPGAPLPEPTGHVFNRHSDLGQTSTIFFSEAQLCPCLRARSVDRSGGGRGGRLRADRAGAALRPFHGRRRQGPPDRSPGREDGRAARPAARPTQGSSPRSPARDDQL